MKDERQVRQQHEHLKELRKRSIKQKDVYGIYHYGSLIDYSSWVLDLENEPFNPQIEEDEQETIEKWL